LIDKRKSGYAAELGVAWQRCTRDGKHPYLQAELDDPTCPHPINAILCEGVDGVHYLYWDRNMTGDHIAERLYVQEEAKPQLGITGAKNITDRQREFFPSLGDAS
jgi:hypothetical protein